MMLVAGLGPGVNTELEEAVQVWPVLCEDVVHLLRVEPPRAEGARVMAALGGEATTAARQLAAQQLGDAARDVTLLVAPHVPEGSAAGKGRWGNLGVESDFGPKWAGAGAVAYMRARS